MKKKVGAGIDLDLLRREIIGRNYKFETPFGERFMTYADYMASGRNVKFIEDYLLTIQESYANTHTEDDVTGKSTTELLHKAQRIIKEAVNAGPDTCLIAIGTGSTGAICRFQEMIGVSMPPATWDRLATICSSFRLDDMADNENFESEFEDHISENQPVIFVGPYEHHSNEVSWRECLAEVRVIDLGPDGSIDLADLERQVSNPRYAGRFKIGSFSAASNVTGLLSPVYEIAEILHRHGALACFDFAASAPYVEIDMNRDDKSCFDAIFISPHKFLGGPGSSGILLFNESIYRKDLPPTCGGGGTVDYVSPQKHDYTTDIEARETAGTPGTYQVMRAALAMELKAAIGVEYIELKEREYASRVLQRFVENPNIDILGSPDPALRMAVISFNIRHGKNFLHPKFVTRLLNDLFGIQSRAGCSCAGPYGHRLLNIGPELSKKYREQIVGGYLGIKPGWVRIGLHYIFDSSDVEFICRAVEFVADCGYLFIPQYTFDLKTGAWTHERDSTWQCADFGIAAALNRSTTVSTGFSSSERESAYHHYLEEAYSLAEKLKALPEAGYKKLPGKLEELSFFKAARFVE